MDVIFFTAAFNGSNGNAFSALTFYKFMLHKIAAIIYRFIKMVGLTKSNDYYPQHKIKCA